MQLRKLQVIALSVMAVGGVALAKQDRFTLRTSDGIAFSEFKGYDAWQSVAVSQTEDGIKAILANPAMIDAYKRGVPDNGTPFPDGAAIVKIEWSRKANTKSPYPVQVPDTLKSVSFIEKNAKRFPDTNGWGYAQFKYDAPSASFTPVGTGSVSKTTCHPCHTRVAARDFIFTSYPLR
jgi:hypothetical protein